MRTTIAHSPTQQTKPAEIPLMDLAAATGHKIRGIARHMTTEGLQLMCELDGRISSVRAARRQLETEYSQQQKFTPQS